MTSTAQMKNRMGFRSDAFRRAPPRFSSGQSAAAVGRVFVSAPKPRRSGPQGAGTFRSRLAAVDLTVEVILCGGDQAARRVVSDCRRVWAGDLKWQPFASANLARPTKARKEDAKMLASWESRDRVLATRGAMKQTAISN